MSTATKVSGDLPVSDGELLIDRGERSELVKEFTKFCAVGADSQGIPERQEKNFSHVVHDEPGLCTYPGGGDRFGHTLRRTPREKEGRNQNKSRS